jgi:hypothetical protein
MLFKPFCVDEVRSAEVRAPEVWLNISIGWTPPLIPIFHALLEISEMFAVSHRLTPLLRA